MADKELGEDLEAGLERALHAMEALQSRLENGEDVDERELTVISRMIATQIEEVRMRLEEAVGPIDPEVIRAEMQSKLSPEDYAEWVATNDERLRLRDEIAKEKSLKEQLEGG